MFGNLFNTGVIHHHSLTTRRCKGGRDHLTSRGRRRTAVCFLIMTNHDYWSVSSSSSKLVNRNAESQSRMCDEYSSNFSSKPAISIRMKSMERASHVKSSVRATLRLPGRRPHRPLASDRFACCSKWMTRSLSTTAETTANDKRRSAVAKTADTMVLLKLWASVRGWEG